MKKMMVLLVVILPISVFAGLLSAELGLGAVQYNGNWNIGSTDYQLADIGYRGSLGLMLITPIIPIDFEIYGNYDWIPEIKAAAISYNEMKSYTYGLNVRYRFHIPPWINIYTSLGALQQTYWYAANDNPSVADTDKETSWGGLGNLGVEFFLPFTKMSVALEGGFKSLFKTQMPYELYVKLNVLFGII